MNNELPTWTDMSDLDKGAALMHAWKRSWEGPSYATEHYPTRYFEDPALLALSEADACKHTVRVTKGWKDWDTDEVDRLYEAALTAAADKARYAAARSKGTE
jgi:hypothetical protein